MTEPASPGRNRRLAQRRPAKHRVKIVCRRGALDLGPNLAVSLLDVSETGARLIVKEAVQPGAKCPSAWRGNRPSAPSRAWATWPGAFPRPTGISASA